MGKTRLIIISALVAFVGYSLYKALSDGPVPNLPDHFWGASSLKGKPEDVSIRPFKIAVDDKILQDLKTRLKTELSGSNNRYAKPLEGIGFEYGINTNFVKKVGEHWLNKYDWRAREKVLNQFPHFKTTISGLEVHFIRVQSSNNKKYKKTKPMIMIHGWPGSIVEFYKIIPMLLDPQGSDVNFELIIPSIPGYGFSEAPHRPGFGTVEAAQLFHKLMTRLGFNEYYAQGGDWGSLITTHMAAFYPKHVKGLHVNMCISSHPRTHISNLLMAIFPSFFVEKHEIPRMVINNFSLFLRETGYFHLQATKPDTIGVALSNSPTGLSAYILEKFSGWTNQDWISKDDGGLLPYFELDELLDNVMIYWLTNSITSSMRLYSESVGPRMMALGVDSVPVTVPSACLNTPKELFFTPQFALRDKYRDLVRFTNAAKGGHFAAFEVPEILAKDVIEFVRQIESAPVRAN